MLLIDSPDGEKLFSNLHLDDFAIARHACTNHNTTPYH